MTIHHLDDRTIRQIAAGEVIERPASAVKELVENSIDADATRIDVAVDAGGTDGIHVADNGIGMTQDEVELAVKKHTTSKITDSTDLETVDTLGFRGEALNAIGAISQLTITTRAETSDQGTRLRFDHGDITSIDPAGRAIGTTVEVAELFTETPARRRFLKAPSTEFDHVNRIVTRYALANPNIAISLRHNDREVFTTTGQDDLEATLLSVYGRSVAESMIPVDGDGVDGYVSHPETTRSTRDYISTFVNDRYVNTDGLRRAIIEAYGHQLANDRFPFATIFIAVPPDQVDVNVHPRKLTVNFHDQASVQDRVRTAVTEALRDHGIVRSGAPRGRTAPDDVQIDPTSGTERSRPPSEPRDNDPPSHPTSSGSSHTTERGEQTPEQERTVSSAQDEPVTKQAHDDTDHESAGQSQSQPQGTTTISEFGTQTTLEADPVETRPEFEQLPAMRLLGQLHETYLLAESTNGLLLIDQHAMDERINYERLKETLDEPAVQELADPVTIELTAREAELFPAYKTALRELGFDAEFVDDTTVEITTVPSVFATPLSPEQLRDVLLESLDGGDETIETHTETIIADLACRPAITGHTSLTEGSIQELLAELDACENPYACPHGRPVLIEINSEELADRFERDYPGHPHRRHT